MNDISLIKNEIGDAKAYVVFAHGAGADKSSDFMRCVTQGLNERKISVLRFNFNYMDKRLVDGKRYPPDRMPKLVACFTQVISQVDSTLPIYLMGKSMGGRVAATLAEEQVSHVHGIVCLGYPFHPQKQPEKLRLEPLQKLQLPTLVIQGDRDALGNKEEIDRYFLSKLCRIQFLFDGDHSFKPRVKSGYTQQQHIESACQMISDFINEQN